MAELFVSQSASAPPVEAAHLLGYFTASIIKDGIGQFLDFIEAEAAMVPKEDE
jgi:hypothetical protein